MDADSLSIRWRQVQVIWACGVITVLCYKSWPQILLVENWSIKMWDMPCQVHFSPCWHCSWSYFVSRSRWDNQAPAVRLHVQKLDWLVYLAEQNYLKVVFWECRWTSSICIGMISVLEKSGLVNTTEIFLCCRNYQFVRVVLMINLVKNGNFYYKMFSQWCGKLLSVTLLTFYMLLGWYCRKHDWNRATWLENY